MPPLSLPDPAHLPEIDAMTPYDAVALFVARAQAATLALAAGARGARL